MKIVLFGINGSFSHTNLAIRCLRDPLERDGFEVVLIEHTLRDRTAHILEHLYREKADIYGFSCYIWNRLYMEELIREIKKVQPKVLIWLGGPEVSYDACDVLERLPEASGVMCGEGEETFCQLCEYYSAEINDGKRAFDLEGVFFSAGCFASPTTSFFVLGIKLPPFIIFEIKYN